MIRIVKIRRHERGLLFRDREFQGVLTPGRHLFLDPAFRVRVDVVSVRETFLVHKELDVIVKSGALGGEARVADLKDHERALVWVDGRFAAVLGPGRYALWTVFHEVAVEVVDARPVRFDHESLSVILESPGAARFLDPFGVEAGQVGLFFKDGEHRATLKPGTHAFWKGLGKVSLQPVDLREMTLDVAGQEIMTSDKVTLRLNAVVTYRVADPVRAVSEVEDHRQALYREAQLALRAAVGTREIDALLTDKDGVARELEGTVKNRAAAFGIEVRALGIRDLILPGDMKDLLNKVTSARRAAEAERISRQEETAAIRSQANTAKIFENNPTLMRLRELEVLENVAEKAKLSIVLGDQGLADRVVKII